MKKIIFAAIVSLVTVLCVSATVADSDTISSVNPSSFVTANVAGLSQDFEFDTGTLVKIYNLMPQNVKDLCVSSYRDIAPRIETSGSNGFTYQGVRIVPIWKNDGMDLKFSYQGHTVVVKNYTKAEFDAIFKSIS